MSVHLIYKNLFEIKLLHHYFLDRGQKIWDSMNQEEKDKIEALYDIRNIFEITPTTECKKILDSHHCLFRITSSGMLIGIKAKPDEIQTELFGTFTPLDSDLTFQFLIRLKDLNFSNYTAIPLQDNGSKMFIFKNFVLDSNIIFPSLSAIPPLFKPDTEYLPGDMLSDQATIQTKLFTALIKTSKNTSTGEDWLTEEGNFNKPLKYVNVSDRYPVANGFFSYTMKKENISPVVTMKSLSGAIINAKTEILPGIFYSIQVDMRNIPQGFYFIHIEGDNGYKDDMTFYLLQQSEIPFGLIEIKVKSNQEDYNLIDQDDHLLSPVFELRFRNRRTYWRYSGKNFNPPFEVQNPLPLTCYGYIEVVKPPDQDDNKVIMLPNPTDSMITAEALIRAEEKKYYSDIHVN